MRSAVSASIAFALSLFCLAVAPRDATAQPPSQEPFNERQAEESEVDSPEEVEADATEPPQADVPGDDTEEPSVAEAQAEEQAEETSEAEAEAPRAQPQNPLREEGEPPSIPRRDVPDYDNRPDPGASAEEVALWIPRILFFPVHLIFEYVLRQPIGWFLTTAERENWTALFIDFFTWNERKSGLVPTAFFDFGLQPSGGLYFWWNDFIADGNDFRASVAFGGVDFLRGTVSDRIRTSDTTELAFTVDALRRPDQLFHGLGWDSRREERSRYIRSYVQGEIAFRFRPWRASEIDFSTDVTWNEFNGDGYAFGNSGDLTLNEAVDQGLYGVPPGFDGYTAYHQRLDIAIDSREPRPAPGHGVRAEGFVEQGFDLEDPIDRRWLRYGGALGGFLDVTANRVFALWAVARFSDPLGDQEVPFIEQVTLGGEPLLMSGFLAGQLIGRSAAVAAIEYRYPIWVYLDGSLHFSVGNVFDEHLRDFDWERLRMSFGIGLRSIGDRDQSFNLLVAFGSEPFVEGANIESVRFVFGSQQGF